jgi:tRNA(fMet)-specific endonuclease VapC
MSIGYLLDTNIAIAILSNEYAAIHFIKQVSQSQMPIYFSTITECEVYAGLKTNEHLQAGKLFAPKRCIDVTSEIAKRAGMIRNEQKSKGRKLKTPDALIIATALENQFILVSRDTDMDFVQDELKVQRIKI